MKRCAERPQAAILFGNLRPPELQDVPWLRFVQWVLRAKNDADGGLRTGVLRASAPSAQDWPFPTGCPKWVLPNRRTFPLSVELSGVPTARITAAAWMRPSFASVTDRLLPAAKGVGSDVSEAPVNHAVPVLLAVVSCDLRSLPEVTLLRDERGLETCLGTVASAIRPRHDQTSLRSLTSDSRTSRPFLFGCQTAVTTRPASSLFNRSRSSAGAGPTRPSVCRERCIRRQGWRPPCRPPGKSSRVAGKAIRRLWPSRC